MKTSAYVVGDIHGELDRLHFLLDAIEVHLEDNDVQNAELIFVGDYIDRGPDSYGVLREVKELVDTNWKQQPRVSKVVALKGNHEDMFVQAEKRPRMENIWLSNGGTQAINSSPHEGKLNNVYDVFGREIFEFCRNLPVYYEIGDVAIAHAGIDHPNLKCEDHDEEQLLWSRVNRMTSHDIYKLTVHGHTPYKRPIIGNGVVYIDTGAVFYETQPLTALFIPDVLDPNIDSLQFIYDNGMELEPTRYG